jgi:hypothetical protein
MGRFGNLTHPTDKLLCMRKVKEYSLNVEMFSEVPETQYMIKFKKIDTEKLTKLIKKVKAKKELPLILIQKEIRNFDSGGKLLSCFHKNSITIEINNKFYPNH